MVCAAGMVSGVSGIAPTSAKVCTTEYAAEVSRRRTTKMIELIKLIYKHGLVNLLNWRIMNGIRKLLVPPKFVCEMAIQAVK